MEKEVFYSCLFLLYLGCPLTYLSLQSGSSPYGRHSRPSKGSSLPSPFAWLLMESPTLLSLPLLLFSLPHHPHPLSVVPLSLFLIHYLHRTLIYPLRLHTNSSTSANRYPLSIALVGFTFNLFNTYLQTRSATHYTRPPITPFLYLRLGFGVPLFFMGMWVNIQSDTVLMRLRAGGAYRIPRGGWFELVASPNYMGEAVEWLGYAVVAWSPAALGFFLYTCSNLVPRARAHLEWYRSKFGGEYPADRKAIVPFIY